MLMGWTVSYWFLKGTYPRYLSLIRSHLHLARRSHMILTCWPHRQRIKKATALVRLDWRQCTAAKLVFVECVIKTPRCSVDVSVLTRVTCVTCHANHVSPASKMQLSEITQTNFQCAAYSVFVLVWKNQSALLCRTILGSMCQKCFCVSFFCLFFPKLLCFVSLITTQL